MKLRILGKDYELVEVPAGALDDAYGECDPSAQVIRIEAGLRRDRLADSVVHEVLHALWAEQNLRPKDGEERIVASLASGLVAVLRDNSNTIPQFMRMKQGRARGADES